MSIKSEPFQRIDVSKQAHWIHTLVALGLNLEVFFAESLWPSFFINNTKLMNQFQPTILSNTGIIRNSCQIILVSMETQSMKKMMIFAYLIKGVRILISGSNFALLDLILSPSTDLL
jgi:hypothetical protein